MSSRTAGKMAKLIEAVRREVIALVAMHAFIAGRTASVDPHDVSLKAYRVADEMVETSTTNLGAELDP